FRPKPLSQAGKKTVPQVVGPGVPIRGHLPTEPINLGRIPRRQTDRFGDPSLGFVVPPTPFRNTFSMWTKGVSAWRCWPYRSLLPSSAPDLPSVTVYGQRSPVLTT